MEHDSNILTAKRDRAIKNVTKATADAKNAQMAKEKFMRATKTMSNLLAVELKKTETLEAKIGGLKLELDTRSAELEAKCSDLQNNLQGYVQELEMAKAELETVKAEMVGMVPTDEADDSANFTYVCATGDLIRAAHRSSPEFNLQPLFDNLLAYLASCPPMSMPLPLLDLVELGCVFPLPY